MAEAIIEDSPRKVKTVEEHTEEQAPQTSSNESSNIGPAKEGETTVDNGVSEYSVCSDEDEDEDKEKDDSNLSSKEDMEASEKELALTRGATTSTKPACQELDDEKDVDESVGQELRRQTLDDESGPSDKRSSPEKPPQEQEASGIQNSDEMRQTNGASAAEVPLPDSAIHQTADNNSAPEPISEPSPCRQNVPPPIPAPIGGVTIGHAGKVQYGDTYVVDPAKKTKKVVESAKKTKKKRKSRDSRSRHEELVYNLQGRYALPTAPSQAFDKRDLDKLLNILDSKNQKLDKDIVTCKRSLDDQKELLEEFFAGDQGPPGGNGPSLNHGQSAGASAATHQTPPDQDFEKNPASGNSTAATAATAGRDPTEESTRSQENGTSTNATPTASSTTSEPSIFRTSGESTSEPSIFRTSGESTSEPSIFKTPGDVRPKTSSHREPLDNPSGGTAEPRGKDKNTTRGAKKKDSKRLSSPPVTEVAVQSGIGHMQTIDTLHHNHVTGFAYIPKFDCICFTQFDHQMLYIFCERTQTMEYHKIPELVNASGMTSLDGQEDRLAISDFSHSRLHLVSVKAIDGYKLVIDRESHVIWKLPFKPADVSRFVEDKLILPSMGDGTINIFTYEGHQVASVFIKGVHVERLYSAAMVDKRTFVAVDNGEDGALHWVSGTGDVSKSYTGKGDHEKSLDQPIQVILDHKGRYIVADQNNNCVHLLDEDGKFQRTLLQRGDALILPRRLYMDTSQRRPRLFVGCGPLQAIEVRIYDYESLCSSVFDTNLGRVFSCFEEEEEDKVTRSESLDNHEPRAAKASSGTTLSDDTNCDGPSIPNSGWMTQHSWVKVPMQCGLAFVLSCGVVVLGFHVMRYIPKSWKSKYLPLL